MRQNLWRAAQALAQLGVGGGGVHPLADARGAVQAAHVAGHVPAHLAHGDCLALEGHQHARVAQRALHALARRGRESDIELKERLSKALIPVPEGFAGQRMIRIENSGLLSNAADILERELHRALFSGPADACVERISVSPELAPHS